MPSNKFNKLTKNIALITVGNFASRVLGFLLIPFYTAVLSTDEYGIADLISTTVSLLFPLFTAVICEAMMRFALEKKYDLKSVWNIGLLVWGIGFLMLLAVSPAIQLVRPLAPYAGYILLYYFTYSINFNASYFVRGVEKVKLYTISGILQTLLTIGLNLIFLLWLKIGLRGYLLSYIIANFLTSLFLICGAGIYRYRPSVPDRALLKEMLSFSIPLIPHQIGWWINKSADKYFILAICGSSINGLYSAAHKIPSVLYVLVSIFSSAWRISSVEDYGTEENVRFFNSVYDKYITVSIVGASFLIAVNKIMARVLYAKAFFIAYKYVPLLILAVLFNGLGEYVGSVYITYKRTKPMMVTTMISVAVNLCLNAVLIPWLGGMGAALATAIGFFALWVIRTVDSKRIIALKMNTANVAVCITLLVAQTLIWVLELPGSVWMNAAIFCVILYMRREMLTMVYERFCSRKRA